MKPPNLIPVRRNYARGYGVEAATGLCRVVTLNRYFAASADTEVELILTLADPETEIQINRQNSSECWGCRLSESRGVCRKPASPWLLPSGLSGSLVIGIRCGYHKLFRAGVEHRLLGIVGAIGQAGHLDL